MVARDSRRIWFGMLAAVGLALSPLSALAAGEAATKKSVAVAAAADLKFALDEVIAQYKKIDPDTEVNATYGSSGNFFTQITEKAPFDLFLSADLEYPKTLIDKKLAKKDSLFVYGVGRLVLWVPKQSPLDVETFGLKVLSDAKARKIAIANPRHAPYGRAAEATLKSQGLYEGVEKRLVFGENIAQTAEFVRTGAADAGLIALSLALSPAMKNDGKFWEVPASFHPTLAQGGVVLEAAKEPAAAEKFRQFLAGKNGQEVLARFGFGRPGA